MCPPPHPLPLLNWGPATEQATSKPPMLFFVYKYYIQILIVPNLLTPGSEFCAHGFMQKAADDHSVKDFRMGTQNTAGNWNYPAGTQKPFLGTKKPIPGKEAAREPETPFRELETPNPVNSGFCFYFKGTYQSPDCHHSTGTVFTRKTNPNTNSAPTVMSGTKRAGELQACSHDVGRATRVTCHACPTWTLSAKGLFDTNVVLLEKNSPVQRNMQEWFKTVWRSNQENTCISYIYNPSWWLLLARIQIAKTCLPIHVEFLQTICVCG